MTTEWPMLENGVVNWGCVFLHPETGLMVNVERADSSDKLKACMHVIIAALFSRDSDAGVRRTYIATIDALFSEDGNVKSQKTKIRLLLGRIMYDREKRARLYVAKMADAVKEQMEQRQEACDPLRALKEM